MRDSVFIDSNVLVYAHDLDAEEKNVKAIRNRPQPLGKPERHH